MGSHREMKGCPLFEEVIFIIYYLTLRIRIISTNDDQNALTEERCSKPAGFDFLLKEKKDGKSR